MDTEESLRTRSASQCELCAASERLAVYEVPASPVVGLASSLLLCATCRQQIEHPETMESHHWRCLNDSMWSAVPAVQVVAWRLLQRLQTEGWARDLLDMLYLEEQTLAWAQAVDGAEDEEEPQLQHVDSCGALLAAGDTVTLIKDLVVKGGGFTAKRGTAVRGITLVMDQVEHIEGRVNGQKLVILTQFVKKN
jgi:protein PhnA